jgi:EAL and modified HD-GYP domain-containing signal transduction protein
MEDEHTTDAVALARQPILDRRESVVGYELRYRPLTRSGGLADPETATARVMVASFADIGLKQLAGDRPALIGVTSQFLHYVGQLPLPPERVVLELAAERPVDAPLIRVLSDLVDHGFRIVIASDLAFDADEALWQLASAVKLDAREVLHAGEKAGDRLATCRQHGLPLIADRIETSEQYEVTRALEFDAFQGHYFGSPRSVRRRSIPTHRLGALRSLTHGTSGASLEDLERHISEDPGLAYRFVRLANSAFYAARSPVGSIRDALVRLGVLAVRRWLTLFSLSGMTDRPQHLLNSSLHRARLCELLAREHPDAIPERAFTAGLFSVLDVLLGRPMRELLAELQLDPRLGSAILDRRGPEGRVLAGVLAYERGDFADLADHGVSLRTVATAYWHAAEWADDATALLA